MGLPEALWLLVYGSALLALVAGAGYWIGRCRPRRPKPAPPRNESPDVQRAMSIVVELDGVSHRLRKALTHYVPAFHKYATRIARYDRQPTMTVADLCDRADEVLKPALRFTAELSHAYSELVQQATHLSTFAELRVDPLTGAANRRSLDETLNRLLAEQSRHSVPLSVAMVDVDFFKQLNDARSHMRGDRVLQDLVAVLSGAVRQCDVVARFGGEEFVIVMPHTDLYGASAMAERIRVAVQEKMPITVSIGLAASAHGDTPSTLFSRADAALYLAKAAGRNCVYTHEGASGSIVGIKARPCEKSPSAVAKAVAASAKTVSSLSKTTVDAHLACPSTAGH